ncbi:hypothetical protein RhiirA4_459931 [Rhizophagus irregularis]|uniref:Uncharacterized protein n=1 Tax=Rhizophagus irregularis TaxID=588596 RepID=A0A2I1GFH1_9GLOM|nr:hypothetical protein RhiirA4_459931 [Rhizophagus irregularis]
MSIENVNCIPILPEGHSHFAFLAFEDKALLDTKYYTSLHEKIVNHINADESSIDNNIKSDDEETLNDVQDFELPKEWKEFVDKVDTNIKNGDPNLQYGLKRFLMAYKKARNTNIQEASLFFTKRKSNNHGSKRLTQGKKSKRSFENIENIDPRTMSPRKNLAESIRQNTKNGDQ